MRHQSNNKIYQKIKSLFPIEYKRNQLPKFLNSFFKILDKKTNKNFARISGKYGKDAYKELIEKYSTLPKEIKNPLEKCNEIVSDLFSGVPRWRSPHLQYNVGAPANTAAVAIYSLALDEDIYNINDGLAGNALVAEQSVTKILANLADIKTKAQGLFTFGGTATNLYAIKVGTKKVSPYSGKKGMPKNIKVMITEDSHFSHIVSADWLGIGTDNVVVIESSPDRSSNLKDAEKKMREIFEKGNLSGSEKNFLKSDRLEVIINCCWLIGRLRLIDDQIYKKLLSLIGSNDYELKYYTFFALQNNATPTLRSVMEQSLVNQDPLIRKMAARSILSIGDEQSLPVLIEALFKEDQDTVVAEISKAVYCLKNPVDHNKILIEVKSRKNENGMIGDESDKWYTDPAIYNIFSEAQDPENICFDLIQKHLRELKSLNPIDLACGTGRIAWQILDNIKFEGILFLVDSSERMVDFVGKAIKRERKYTQSIKVIKSSIIDLPKTMKLKSNFIISSFGFPSKLSNKNLCLEELKAVHSLLLNNGLFFTIGWDETFNDELNMMWFKYIPDEICAADFEEWRRKRAERINSPRNCNLTWLKKSIYAPLQFTSLKETVQVIGYLFGRDAAQYVIKTGKIEWSMSLGITCNTKEEIAKIIENYERN